MKRGRGFAANTCGVELSMRVAHSGGRSALTCGDWTPAFAGGTGQEARFQPRRRDQPGKTERKKSPTPPGT